MEEEITTQKLLTVKEVAAIFKVGEATVTGWVRQNKLQALRFGYRSYRFTQEEIDRFIRDWQNSGATE